MTTGPKLTTGPKYVETPATFKALLQIQQLCESAIVWDDDKSVNGTLTDRAWLAKCILDIISEKVGT